MTPADRTICDSFFAQPTTTTFENLKNLTQTALGSESHTMKTIHHDKRRSSPAASLTKKRHSSNVGWNNFIRSSFPSQKLDISRKNIDPILDVQKTVQDASQNDIPSNHMDAIEKDKSSQFPDPDPFKSCAMDTVQDTAQNDIPSSRIDEASQFPDPDPFKSRAMNTVQDIAHSDILSQHMETVQNIESS
ncbi:MAG: hypothetical protein HETSPECPRED_003819 [Heterodermia speciosa]|uniref:Uncharacterized protein n=1 Tax=Heterodermia speciosa TaxID=116794 RepID=A0A8H3F6J6_9LECA|nr:MAG: hypothetical protein HETSPECPRED_003819 [Heterodermia speciosa]